MSLHAIAARGGRFDHFVGDMWVFVGLKHPFVPTAGVFPNFLRQDGTRVIDAQQG